MRDGEDQRAEQGDGERQRTRQRVVGVSVRPQAQLVDQVGGAEDDRFDREDDLEHPQEIRDVRRAVGRASAQQRRGGVEEEADVGRAQTDQKGGERKQRDGEAQNSHGAGTGGVGSERGGKKRTNRTPGAKEGGVKMNGRRGGG